MILSRLVLAAALSILIIILGMPNVEQSRTEVQSKQAFILAQQIKAGQLPPTTPDPWGNPFDIRHTSTGTTVVTSLGVNGRTPSEGYDSDDVSTSMSDPPAKRTGRRKRIQLLITLVAAALPWVILVAYALYSRFFRDRAHVV